MPAGGVEGRASQDEVKAFIEEATAGDYDHLLRTAIKWFDCH